MEYEVGSDRADHRAHKRTVCAHAAARQNIQAVFPQTAAPVNRGSIQRQHPRTSACKNGSIVCGNGGRPVMSPLWNVTEPLRSPPRLPQCVRNRTIPCTWHLGTPRGNLLPDIADRQRMVAGSYPRANTSRAMKLPIIPLIPVTRHVLFCTLRYISGGASHVPSSIFAPASSFIVGLHTAPATCRASQLESSAGRCSTLLGRSRGLPARLRRRAASAPANHSAQTSWLDRGGKG